MNPFRELCIQYDGIYGVIKGYTDSSSVENLLKQLKKGITERDYEPIQYTLQQLVGWYDRNLLDIISDAYVFNANEHERTHALLKRILDTITPEDVLEGKPTHFAECPNEISSNSDPLIFISHRSSDKKYGDALCNFLTGLGVRDNQIIYTSHPLHKIPLGQNIYDYLRTHIRSNIFMIILWSDAYLESPVCMNEMGAAWVVQSDYTNIYVPEFSFGNPKYHQCAVDTNKMGAVLKNDAHCRASMLELKDQVAAMFHLEVNEQRVLYLLEQFMEEITP